MRRKRTSGASEPSQRPTRSRSPVRSTKPKDTPAPKRPKSPPSSTRPLSPHTPEHPPPPARPPPLLLTQNVHTEEERSQLEHELWSLLTEDGVPKVTDVSPEILFTLTDCATRWGNRDRVMWVTNRTLDPGKQQSMGIRVDARIRSQVHSTGESKRSWMTQHGWLRTCYVRDRQPGAPWELIQVTCPIQNAVSLPQVWSDMICFTHRPAYMVRQRDVTLRHQDPRFVWSIPQLPRSHEDLGCLVLHQRLKSGSLQLSLLHTQGSRCGIVFSRGSSPVE